MMRKYLFLILAILLISPLASADYALQIQALTNSPADNVNNYIGYNPYPPTTQVNNSIIWIPVGGTIRIAEIYDYSGTAGTAEPYRYFIRVNNGTETLINNLSVSASERVFSNTTLSIAVNAGDFIEINRSHPTWATNPLTNIVGGYIIVNTSGSNLGYTLHSQGISNSPADSAVNYLSDIPTVPFVTSGLFTMPPPANGTATAATLIDNATTAGTAEAYAYYLNKSYTTSNLIKSLSLAAGRRVFTNYSMNLPITINDNLIVSRTHPAWSTNPLVNTVGGVVFVNTMEGGNPLGYPLTMEAIAFSPADATTYYFGNRPIAPSTTAATNKIYFRQPGTISKVYLDSYSSTAGTSEAWPMYIRVNNSVDYYISTTSLSAVMRTWTNNSINIPVAAGDYIEVKTVTPTWGTNPSSSAFGGYAYLTVTDPRPVPSLRSNVTSGFTPAVVQFNDTSNLTPTAWQWFWTNLDNSTTTMFSTSQYPVQTFDTGRFNIQLNVTNASGFRKNVDQNYLINVNPYGGYDGWNQQDIYMDAYYNITWHITDAADGTPILVTTIIDSSGQTLVTNNSYGSLTEQPGTIAVSFISTGYYGKTVTYNIDSDQEYTVQLTKESGAVVKQQNTWYSPHQVSFEVWNSYGNKMPGVLVNATANGTTLPSSYLENLYGIEPAVANDMLNQTLIMEGPTGSDGEVVFTMHGSIAYRIQLTNPTTGKTYSSEVFPLKDQYVLRLETSSTIPNISANVYSNLRNTTLTFSEPNNSYVTMGLNYSDASGQTTNVHFYVTFDNNKTVVYDQDLGNPGTSTVYANYTTKNIRGIRYMWNYTAVRS